MARRWRLLLLIPILGCGKDPGTLPLRYERLVLEPVPGVTAPAARRVVLALDGQDICERFEYPGGNADLLHGRAEVKFGTPPLMILNELPEEPYDTLAIEMRRPLGGRMLLTMTDEKGELLHRAAIHFGHVAPKDLESIEFDLRKSLESEHSPAKVILQYPKAGGRGTITSIEFLCKAPEADLPAPGEASHVNLGTDGRRVIGLSPRFPLQCSLGAGPAHSLSFDCAAFDATGQSTRGSIVLSFMGRAGTLLETREIQVKPEGWTTHTIPLGSQTATMPVACVRFSPAIPTSDRQHAVAMVMSEPVLSREDSIRGSASDGPRTVLVITSDTHRGDHLGALKDGADVKTPFLDQLAARGVLFEDCWAGANITNPTHITLMTGVPIHDHGVCYNDRSASPRLETLAEQFSRAGWRTYAALSVAHLGWSGLDQGFERLSCPDRAQRDSRETLAVLEGWLAEENLERRDLFVWLHLFDAHGPYAPCEPYDRMYRPANSDSGADVCRTDWPGVDFPDWDEAVTDPRTYEALYKGEVTYQDNALAGLFRRQRRLGSGVVAFVGDHGENLLDYHPNFDHGSITPATLHVPLIIAWPEAPAGTRVEQPVTQGDFGRTVLDVAGLGSVEFPGRNLMLRAESDPDAGPPARISMRANAWQASVQQGRWFLIQNLYSTSRRDRGKRCIDHEITLYDLQADPLCSTDLRDRERDVARQLRTTLVRRLESSRVREFLGQDLRRDEGTMKTLASLGYSAGSALPDENPWIDAACECPPCRRFPLLAAGEPGVKLAAINKR